MANVNQTSNTGNTDEFQPVSEDEIGVLTVLSDTSCINTHKTKLIRIICSVIVIILIVLAVVIPTVMLLKKKTDMVTTTTTDTSITTTTTTTLTTTVTTTKATTTTTTAFLPTINISTNTTCSQIGITVAGDDDDGDKLNELSYPRGLYIDDEQTIYIADSGNHRIVEWKKDATSGQIVAGRNKSGKLDNELNDPSDVIGDIQNDNLIICDYGNSRIVRWPRQKGTIGQTIILNIACVGLAISNNGFIYVSDYSKHEIRRWKIGDAGETVVVIDNLSVGATKYFSSPTYIFVDQNDSLYMSNDGNHLVIKWLKGATVRTVAAGVRSLTSNLTKLNYPRGVIVDQLGAVYVADSQHHRVLRCWKEPTNCTIIAGGNGPGKRPNQFDSPTGLSFDREGNLYVVDKNNHRVQKFNINCTLND